MRYLPLLALAAIAACDAAPTPLIPAAGGAAALAADHAAPRTEGSFTTPDGVRLHYRVVGTGPDTVVALHGGPGFSMSIMAEDWAPLAAGRTVVYYDQRGGGRSELVDPSRLSLEHMVADLDAVRAHFGLARLNLIGHSWGALLAASYAVAHPARVERMVLVTPGPVSSTHDEEFVANRTARLTPAELQTIGDLIPQVIAGPEPVAACEALLGTLFRAYVADPASLSRHRGGWCDVPEDAARAMLVTNAVVGGSLGAWDLRPSLRTLSVPTLVVHGAADPIPLGSSQGYAEVQGARLHVIAGSGHFPWLETPVEFFTTVNTFLRRAPQSF